MRCSVQACGIICSIWEDLSNSVPQPLQPAVSNIRSSNLYDPGGTEIFRSMIAAVIFPFAARVAASVVVTATVLNAFQNDYFTGMDPLTPAPGVTRARWLAFALIMAIGLVAAWILFMMSAVYLRRSYNAAGEGLDVHTFHTEGLLYFIVAAFSIVMVGFVIPPVAQIVTAAAHFPIHESMPEKPWGAPAAVPPS